ncbi:HAD family hydrolase [Maridesulfovibrio salexigens]|uniref:HAD family hydrolase n=1 Tax=Maridesulfovibrio salexigens (strain ATCC 14822 / DSM 2638 / NCIMB 8403 / VKM B-1763) TaxID=526222 RepID=C6BTK2_MARSD|nr:HAD family hydrolase [Maridesulfovibrio salexigens]ACS81683.1 HAD family hydrolase [Maridesulfovibrio salexigens DSM 2638]
MILIFDLDDTLYDEMSFVTSGLHAVAKHGETAFGLNAEQSYLDLIKILNEQGRGRVFNLWLDSHGIMSKGRVSECIKIYRHHKPKLTLFPQAQALLSKYHGVTPLYLVTDGHKVVQHNKVKALGLESKFKRIFITHRFGIKNAKPSTYCFELIRRSEGCDWSDMIYVGDNPSKDFVNLNKVGMLTVRVLTGGHRHVEAKHGYDAKIVIKDLHEFNKQIFTSILGAGNE